MRENGDDEANAGRNWEINSLYVINSVTVVVGTLNEIRTVPDMISRRVTVRVTRRRLDRW